MRVENEKKYNKLIVILSIAIPLVVAALFGIKLPNVEPLTFLPPIYATISPLSTDKSIPLSTCKLESPIG